MPSRVFAAQLNKLDEVSAFIEQELELMDCPMKAMSAISVAFEELFVNVARYAYPDKEGTVEVSVDPVDGGVEIKLADEGIPFDPLKKADPDVTLDAKDRQIGGLGIFMVKKMMDSIDYEYKDNKNIISFIKKF